MPAQSPRTQRRPDRPRSEPEDALNETSDRRIAVIGLGYVGLPLALALREAGLDVVGVDASPRRVAELCAGHSPIDDIDDARLAAGLAAGFQIVGPDQGRLAAVDSVFVCVPSPMTTSEGSELR